MYLTTSPAVAGTGGSSALALLLAREMAIRAASAWAREVCLRKQILRLKRMLANKTMELDFFRRALQRVGARRRPEARRWRRGIYDEIRTRVPFQGSLSIERMCELAQVSRASFYRYLRYGWPVEEEVDLCSTVQEVVLEHRWRYGYRRVTAELRSRGMLVNHKRVARIMRAGNVSKNSILHLRVFEVQPNALRRTKY